MSYTKEATSSTNSRSPSRIALDPCKLNILKLHHKHKKLNQCSSPDIYIYIISATTVSTMHIHDLKRGESGRKIGRNTAAVLWGCFLLRAFRLTSFALDVDCDLFVEAFRFDLSDLLSLGSYNCGKATLDVSEALERSDMEALVLLAC
jgi:hypothetical protein